MIKFNKDYKIILLTISTFFLFNTTLSSCPDSNASLRLHVGTEAQDEVGAKDDTFPRIKQVLNAHSGSKRTQEFSSKEIQEIWMYICSEIMTYDPLIEQKQEGSLAKIFRSLKNRLLSIDKKVASGELKLIKDLHLLQEQGVDSSDQKEPIRVGVLGLTANPLNWGHIMGLLDLIDKENFNVAVLLVQGGMKYKDLPEQDRVPEKIRHGFIKKVVSKLSPLIQYTDVGRNTENIGEFNVHKLLQLNPKRKMDVYYLTGSETKERTYGVVRNFVRAAQEYQHTFSSLHKLSLGVVPIGEFGKGILTEAMLYSIIDEIKRGGDAQDIPINGHILLEDYDLVVHSTAYRRGDRSLVPSAINMEAQKRGFYGYPPTVMRNGRLVTLSMDEVIKERLKPLTKDLARIIQSKFQGRGAIITIDGNSASGKSLIAKLLQKDLKDANRSVEVWGLDTKLKSRIYRHAIQKLVVGESLDDEEAALVGEEEKASIVPGNEYLEESSFFNSSEIREVLAQAHIFFVSNQQQTVIEIKDPYDQETKKILSSPLKIFLKQGGILIVEGKYSNLPELQKFSDYRVRVHEDPESVQVRFELRTRKQSPNDADRQLVFFQKGLTPSFNRYTEQTKDLVDVTFNVSPENPEQWRLEFSDPKDHTMLSSNDNIEAVPRRWMKDPVKRISVQDLELYAAHVRKETLKIWQQIHGPLSGAFSIIELYTAFFLNYVDVETYLMQGEDRVRFIPKGTSSTSLYATGAFAGLIDPQRIINIDARDLEVVPNKFGFSDASLYKIGMSFEQGIGMALAGKYTDRDFPVVVFQSDGALQIGVDHAAKFAANLKLNNLVFIVDVNRIQSAYSIDQVDPTLKEEEEEGKDLKRQRAIWEAYGWDVIEIDGHNFQEIQQAYDQIGLTEKPLLILAKTVKGKGIPFMEGQIGYSHKFKNEKELQVAKEDLEGNINKYSRQGHVVVYPEWNGAQRIKANPQRMFIPDVFSESTYDDLEKFTKRWIEQFIEKNPEKVMIINTDNPSPFPKDIAVFSSDKKSPYVFAGINERFALNLAGGLSNEDIMPIYIGPAAHMPILAEDWKMYGIDRQPIMIISRSAGSALSHWGPGHLTYEDIDLFRAPGTVVFQPATTFDLNMILNNYYSNADEMKPAYIRLQETENVDIQVDLGSETEIYNNGFYVLEESVDNDETFVSFIVSGKTVAEAVKTGKQLKAYDIPYKIINVFNLSDVNKNKLSAVLSKAELIISAIDARSTSLSLLVFNALDEGRDRIVPLGVDFEGDYSGEQGIMEKNKIDAKGLLWTSLDNWGKGIGELSSRTSSAKIEHVELNSSL